MNSNEFKYELGKEAMMHACFFYYQLLEEGEFTAGQTAYWLFEKATCWDLLDLRILESEGVSSDIDARFVREAALIYILCMLMNQYEESEPHEYPSDTDFAVNIVKNQGHELIPETLQLVNSISNNDVEMFKHTMAIIFERYVKGRFARLT